MFFFIGSAVSALLIPLAPEIVDLTLGKSYAGAALPLAIMLLYPLQPALGHITHTLFYATAQLKLYVKFAIPLMALGLLLTYFLLADPYAQIPGLGLGAVGLPIKIVVLAVITVYANTWLISRHYGWEFQWKYQVSCLGTLLALSTSIVSLARGATWVTGIYVAEIPFLTICASLYGICLVYFLDSFPSLFGLTESEYQDLRRRLLGRLGLAKQPGSGSP